VRLSSWLRSGLRVFSPHAFERAFLVVCLLIGGIPCYAQGVAARVVASVNEASLVTLKGNVHPLATPEFDQGLVPASTPLTHVQLVLKRSAQQEAALEAYLASAQQANSPNYHKWLTPEQFGSLYGPADADIEKLTMWLQGHGFTVNNVAKGKTSIDFSGTAAQAGDAFHVEIHSFNANGKQFNANTTDPQIPAAFAPVVSGVAHLNTDEPKSFNVPAGGGHYDPSLKRLVSESSVSPTAGSGPHPDFTSPPTEATSSDLYVTPADAATIYNTPNQTLNAKFSGGSSYDGTGVKIGILGQSNINPSIVANYRSLFLGDTTDITKVLTISDPSNVGIKPEGSREIYLDTELAGGLAPGASIYLYVGQDVDDAAEQALADNTVDIFSISYGQCEQRLGQSGNQVEKNLWQQAAAQGITVFVATGDEGSAACDEDKKDTPAAVQGLTVNGIASTVYNIAVGGTDYYPLENNFKNYVNTNNTSAQHYGSAMGYIPESTWNDSTSTNEMLSMNVPLKSSNIDAGSGGPSNCGVWVSEQCTSGYLKPDWQIGTTPDDKVRDLPDVSLLAGTGYLSAKWLVCNESKVTGTETLRNCSTPPSGNPPFMFASSGGTSASTPALAGIFALIVQKNGQRQGQAAPTFYSLANAPNQTTFHDVTVGNISVPCVQGTPACILNDAKSAYYLSGYNTTTGYDLATGLGSVDVTQLVSNWPAPGSPSTPPPGIITPTVTVTVSPAAIVSAATATLTATVAGTSGAPVPTGTVTFSTNSSNVANATAPGLTPLGTATLNNGSASFTVPANALNVGTVSIETTYTPDTASSSTYFSATAAPASLTVLLGTFTVSGSAVTISGAPASGTSTITVTTSAGFATAGKVDLSCTLTSMPANANPAYFPTCTLAQSSVQVSSSTPGTVTATFATTTTATSALSHGRSGPFGSPWSNAGGLTLAGALLLIFPRRRAGRTILALFVAMVILAGTGCSSNGNHTPTTPSATPGTTPGVYTFTVAGIINGATASAPVAAGVAVTVN
jgi:subtilase family serine protease